MKKTNKMESGNFVFYFVVFLVIAHFVAGFIFLVSKLSGPVAEEGPDAESEQQA